MASTEPKIVQLARERIAHWSRVLDAYAVLRGAEDEARLNGSADLDKLLVGPHPKFRAWAQAAVDPSARQVAMAALILAKSETPRQVLDAMRSTSLSLKVKSAYDSISAGFDYEMRVKGRILKGESGALCFADENAKRAILGDLGIDPSDCEVQTYDEDLPF